MKPSMVEKWHQNSPSEDDSYCEEGVTAESVLFPYVAAREEGRNVVTI